MALSDCPKCWNTPCECGYEFKNWGVLHFIKYVVGIVVGYIAYKFKTRPV